MKSAGDSSLTQKKAENWLTFNDKFGLFKEGFVNLFVRTTVAFFQDPKLLVNIFAKSLTQAHPLLFALNLYSLVTAAWWLSSWLLS